MELSNNQRIDAMAYAKKVLAQVSKGLGTSGSFVQTLRALIVKSTDVTIGAAVANRVDNHFRARKIFIYVLAHGGWRDETGQTYFVLASSPTHYWYKSLSE